MVRTCSINENGIKKGTWSEEEDRKLKAYIERYGHWNWRQLPKYAGLARCGKSCRLRWMNYLRPGVKRGNYTKEEEDLIIALHEKLGNRWSEIASKLPGRTDNEVKNYWHTTLKKRFQKVEKPTKENPNGLATDLHHHHQLFKVSQQVLESSSFESSLSSSSSEVESSTTATSLNSKRVVEDGISFAESIESFWNEPFVLDTSYYDQYWNSSNFEEGFFSF